MHLKVWGNRERVRTIELMTHDFQKSKNKQNKCRNFFFSDGFVSCCTAAKSAQSGLEMGKGQRSEVWLRPVDDPFAVQVLQAAADLG